MLVIWAALALNLITLIVYYLDKSAAKNNSWRTPEKTLHILALLGGWPGALLAQRLFRHKSKKTSFQGVFWLTVILNCTLLFWIITHVSNPSLSFLMRVA
jgi:uncharacterized membrane protein YsdA (DUF1294 family)